MTDNSGHNLRYEIVCEKWDDDREDYITEPLPVLFGTRAEAEALADKYRAEHVIDRSFYPGPEAYLDVFEMVIKGDRVFRTGA